MNNIRLAATVAFVRDMVTDRSGERFDRVYGELNQAITEHGITAVRNFLKKEAGTCPLITKVALSPGKEYFFAKNLKKVFLDFSEAYLTLETHRRFLWRSRPDIEEWDVRNTNIVSRNGLMMLVSGDHPQYVNGTYLSVWIEYGEECPDCGTLFLDYEGQTFCDSCISNYSIRNYSHRVEDELGMEETNEVRFGVELEYEKVSALDVFRTLKGHALPKHDGSIQDGVEIVTKPASLNTHKQSLKSFYNHIKVKPASNTGMHVHIEKAKLSQLQIGFLMEFLNKDALIPYIRVIAGRNYDNNSYCRTNKGHTMTYGVYYDENSRKLARSSTDKYSPLNTAKAHTVEVRIFSSPADHEECSAKLDFVAALVSYSSPYSVSVKSLKDKFNWQLFTDYVVRNKQQYKDFYNYYVASGRLDEVRV